eukprot:2082453-Rhodomonas_salina.1
MSGADSGFFAARDALLESEGQPGSGRERQRDRETRDTERDRETHQPAQPPQEPPVRAMHLARSPSWLACLRNHETQPSRQHLILQKRAFRPRETLQCEQARLYCARHRNSSLSRVTSAHVRVRGNSSLNQRSSVQGADDSPQGGLFSARGRLIRRATHRVCAVLTWRVRAAARMRKTRSVFGMLQGGSSREASSERGTASPSDRPSLMPVAARADALLSKLAVSAGADGASGGQCGRCARPGACS